LFSTLSDRLASAKSSVQTNVTNVPIPFAALFRQAGVVAGSTPMPSSKSLAIPGDVLSKFDVNPFEASMPYLDLAAVPTTSLPTPQPHQEIQPMSFLTSVISGLSKAENFLISIFTKASAVAKVITSVSPKTLAAVLAVFYDITKLIASEGVAVADISSGKYQQGVGELFSPTTQALLTAIAADIKDLDSTVIDDLKKLGIAINPPAAVAPVAVTPVATA